MKYLNISLLFLLVPALISCSKGNGPGAVLVREEIRIPSESGPFFTHETKRKPPKSRPVNRPLQVTFEADSVLYAAVSQDGQWLLYISGSREEAGLWLRSADPNQVILPKRLTRDRGNQSAPAFSPDGRWIAFVGRGYDVKGDIYLMELENHDAGPRRLTGRDTEDGAPCFSADGKTLFFHQIRPGETQRHLVVLSPSDDDPRARTLDMGGDGAFPSISPDGKQCAFVSFRDDPGGDIFLANLETNMVVPLTRGPDRDLFPVWSRDGRYIYFSRFALDTDLDGSVTLKDNAVICRVKAYEQNPFAYSLTSASYSAYQPMVSSSRLYFLSTRKGVSNLWALPLEGEIPSKENAEAQIQLARELAQRVPPNDHLAILAYYSVLERVPDQDPFGGKAAYAIGMLYERMQMPDAAERFFRLTIESFNLTLPEAAFSRIQMIGIHARRRFNQDPTEAWRQRALKESLSELKAVSAQNPGSAEIQAHSLIEQSRLLTELGRDSESLLGAIRLLDRVVEMGAAPRSQVAEALVLRADLFSRIGQAESLFPAYARVIKEFPEVEEWADRAVERILELSIAGADSGIPEGRTRLLARIADKYRVNLPRLAMGAWNSIGDIHFAADEWTLAKEAYRHVLELFPVVSNQTAAARLALAEILYREERFRQTLDLYETEMASRPYRDYLYDLARSAYVRKSIAAGEHLFRLGEVPAARNIFSTLIREDYSIVEAHRGYIKCAAAQGQIPDVLTLYREKSNQSPDDPISLYATGLCLTYVGGEEALKKAQSLIERAIQQNGQVEYFHQTLGYVLEVLETVHKEPRRLEAALESYRKAYFLNDPVNHPENAAHLALNLGNGHFLLGQYGKAFEYYTKRFESEVPFDQEETEILFYRRFGASAFQMREREQPIQAFSKAVDLIEKRIQLKRASEIMGRINQHILDRIITPALERPESKKRAKKLAERQVALNRRLYEVSREQVGPPPNPAWKDYREAIELLVSEQEGVIRDLSPVIPKNRTEILQSLSHMVVRVRDALSFPQHLMHLKAEMLDRLGLALQEAERWQQARETFERAYNLNEHLGILTNLISNQRSVAYNAYMEAGTLAGEDRKRLLNLASDGFSHVIELVRKHGVTKKAPDQRKKALISIALDVTLDEVSSSQAMYGFSAEQEERLAEAFITRIRIELGLLGPAREALKRQLARYPPDGPVSDKDLYGVSLLYHRAAHLAYALKNHIEAFDHFRRSAELSHQLENPVSAAVNVTNMAHLLAHMPSESPGKDRYRTQLSVLDRKTTRLLERFPVVLERLVIPSYHNNMGVYALNMLRQDSDEAVEMAAHNMKLFERAGIHFSMGLKWLKEYSPTNDRQVLALRAALRLNLTEMAFACGEPQKAHEQLDAALEIARHGLLPDYEWRILAGLGRLEEALEVLESVSIIRARCGPGEVTGRFSPLVRDLLDAGQPEEAFNLVERLSEIERVHRLTPMVLGIISRDERMMLRRTYPRLLTIQDLKRKLAEAGDPGDKEYLSKRLSQENMLLKNDLGDNREHLPSLARLAGSEAIQDRLMILMGIALHAEDEADAAVKAGMNNEAVSSNRRYDDLTARYGLALEEGRATVQEGEAPGIPGILLPNPVEAIDVMEMLPEDGTCIRLFAMPDSEQGWIAFTVTPDEIYVEPFDPDSPFEFSGGGTQVLVYEDPSRLPVRITEPVALSATHLVRSIQNRKPFKQNLLLLPPGYALPEIFHSRSLPASTNGVEIIEALPEAHTLLLSMVFHRAGSVPTRPGERPMTYMAMDLDRGRTFPLTRLADRLSNVSLAILPGVSTADIYPVGHLFSLFGVPTVLLPRHPRGEHAFVEHFLRVYAATSVREAVQKTGSITGTAEGWIQLGYWGMTPQEAHTFSSEHFTRYVRMGVEAYKTNRPRKALTLFENALNITSENKDFERFLPDLHRYARESAFAANLFDRAVRHARALVDILVEKQPDSEAYAGALLKLGLIQARAEQYDQAIPVLEEATELMANLELGPQQVAALSDLGIVLENATEYDRALLQFQSAASLSKALNKKELLARQHMSIGRVQDLRLSCYARAQQFYGKAYAIYKELNQKENMAQSLLDMGRCFRLIGNFKEADRHYRQALEMVETDTQQLRLMAKILIEQANNAWYQGRYQEAFELQKKVYDLARQHNWPLEQVIALNTSGLIWWTLGDNQRALRDLEEALSKARNLKARRDEVATTLNNIGLVYREMGQYREALETLDKALAIDRDINSRWAIAYDLRNKALTYLRMGEPEKAVPLFEEALTVAAGIGNRINEAKVMLGLGEALMSLERYAEAQNAFEDALKLSRSMALRETEWRALYGLGRLLLKDDHKHEARDLLTRATKVIEGMRAAIKLSQLKDGFINNKMSVYETLVSLLVDLGDTSGAFDTAERSRARNLIDLLGNQRLNLHGVIDQELYDQQNRLRARIREYEALLAQAGEETERTVYGRTLKRLYDEYQDLLLEIQAKNPELASLISVNPLSLNDIRKLLEPDVALIAFYVVPDEILCWLVKPESVELFRTPIGRKTLGQSILNYRHMIQNLEPLETQSNELHSWLISRVMPSLYKVRALGIVPYDTLHYLSFATLYDGENYMADRFSLFYLPSASVLRYTMGRRTERKIVRVLAIGNPALRTPALELPFAEREVGTIGWNFPDTTVLTKERATESWLVRHIEEFGIIHIASHGDFNPINPLFSAVKLVKDSHEDGDLEASEVFGLRINADLIVLSACQTGLGKVTSGDDVIGMNQAFLYAGTHAIVSSLWRVSDISTAMLVKQFYREYAAKNKSDSLRKAILHVKNRYPHPGYWGAFVLVGDYF